MIDIFTTKVANEIPGNGNIPDQKKIMVEMEAQKVDEVEKAAGGELQKSFEHFNLFLSPPLLYYLGAIATR
jgi:hypothetical protein